MTTALPSFRSICRSLLILPILASGMALANEGTQSENLIPNGDFSKGNVGFVSQLPYIKPADNCLWGGYYTIASRFDRPQLHRLIGQEPYLVPNRHTGEEKILFANSGGVEAQVLWATEVKVQPNTKYLITFNCISLSGDQYDGTPSRQVPDMTWDPDFEITANGESSGLFQAGLGKYYKGSMIWTSKKATTADLKIIRAKLAHGGGIVGICNIQMVPYKE